MTTFPHGPSHRWARAPARGRAAYALVKGSEERARGSQDRPRRGDVPACWRLLGRRREHAGHRGGLLKLTAAGDKRLERARPRPHGSLGGLLPVSRVSHLCGQYS